jgi:amino acid transporter
MATTGLQHTEESADKGLKGGALGLISSVVMGVASTAPAYSLAATLAFVVVLVGVHAPIAAVLAFVPIFLTSIGYSELNKADPDCGTTFTWATRAFGPKTGWAGGWGIVAADILVMASLAQVAGQYVFLLFGADGIGTDPASGWVLLVGIVWIVAMTYICYRGIEVSANFQKVLLGIEIVMLLVLSVTALVRALGSHPPATAIHPSGSWLNPFGTPTFSAFVGALILMLFIYWGWDTAVSVNEETADKSKTPGRAAIISTLLLLVTYAIVIFAVLAFAGVGAKGIGLNNPKNTSDVLSVLGGAIFGTSGFGTVLSRLLILMVLSSAAA